MCRPKDMPRVLQLFLKYGEPWSCSRVTLVSSRLIIRSNRCLWRVQTSRKCPKEGNPCWRGRLSTVDLLINAACLVQEKKICIKSSWSRLMYVLGGQLYWFFHLSKDSLFKYCAGLRLETYLKALFTCPISKRDFAISWFVFMYKIVCCKPAGLMQNRTYM